MARSPDAGRTEPDLAAPPHATLWASLVYAISTLLLGYPALAGKFLVNARSDQYIAGYAFRDFAAQSLKSGHGIPQWSPWIEGGMPYIGAMHGDIFYPTALLRWMLPTDVAMTWEFLIHLFLCGLLTYLFLRAWRFGFWAALAGGVAYMLGGSIAGLASPGHDGKLFVSTILPAVLLMLTRGIRDGRRWAWGALALLVGLAALSPHPQLLQYMLLAAGAYSLFLAFTTDAVAGKLSTRTAVVRLGLAAVAVVVGLMISALQYMPLFAYQPWSPRAAPHDWFTATSFSYPIEEVLNWYWPQFTGVLDDYWGRNGIHLHSDYFGVVVLIVAGAAFGATSRKIFRRFWLWTGAISLIWAFGGNTPFYHIPMAIVPKTAYLRAPSTIIFITAFSVAVLAAIGMERLLARQVSPKYAMGWGIAATVLAVIMSVGGYSVLANTVASSIAAERYPPEVRAQAVAQLLTPRIQQNTRAALIDIWRGFLFAALAAGAIWAMLTDRLKARHAAIALVALMAVDLWSIERLYWIFSPPASVIFASDPAAQAIRADIRKTGVPGRVLPAPFGSGIVTELGRLDRTFTGDKLWVDTLRVDSGYHGNELGMYQRLIQLDSGQIRFSPQFWRHENIRYWYTGADDSLMTQLAQQMHIAPFTKLAGPVRNASGSMVYSYKIAADNPPAWVASAIVKAPQDQALGTVLNPQFDPRTAAIVDTSMHDISGVQLKAAPAPAQTTANVTSFAAGAIDVTLSQPATAGQALVVSENYYPGWKATADGKAAPIGLMNYNLIGVALPEGAKSIQLRFTDAAYEKGKRVTFVALALAIIGLVSGWIVDRRRPSITVAAA